MIRTEYPRLGETLYTGKLPNGLDLLVVPRRGFTKKLAYFVTNYGSIHTDFSLDGKDFQAPDGVAHYLEHKMFDLPGRDVAEEFAALGAMVNAFTSYDITAYYFSCTDNFEQCLNLLLEFVSTAYFTEESVQKEQGIIGQEIGMNDDDPGTVVFENLMRGLFDRHPIRVPILGTAETISRITPRVLYDCHRAFYTPGNMVLCVVGDVDPEEIARMAGQALPAEAVSVGQKQCTWPETMEASVPLIKEKMEISMPTFSMAFKCEAVEDGDDVMHQELIGDLAAEALFGESSELYLQMYEDGIIDSSFGGGFECVDGVSMLLCSGDSTDPEAVRDAIVEGVPRLLEKGISGQTFARMKRSALGRRVRDLDSFDGTCFRLCAYHFSGFDYFRFPQAYEAVTLEEITRFLTRVVTPSRCCLSVVEPLS